MLARQPGQLCIKLELLTFLVKGRKTPGGAFWEGKASECHMSLGVRPISSGTRCDRSPALLQARPGGPTATEMIPLMWISTHFVQTYFIYLNTWKEKGGPCPMVLHVNSFLAPQQCLPGHGVGGQPQ